MILVGDYHLQFLIVKRNKMIIKTFFSDEIFKIYVEEFGNKKINFVLIPGGYHTGICYTTKPDGAAGWAETLSKRYKVLVTDIPGTGRSGFVKFDKIDSSFNVEAYKSLISSLEGKIILLTHSLSGPLGFKLVEQLPKKISHLISIEPGLLGNIQESSKPINESDNKINIKFKGFDFCLDMTQMQPPSQQLINRLKKDSTKNFPADEKSQKQYEASLQSVHPRLMYERFNINDSQLKIMDFDKLKTTKFLIVTGTEDPVHINEDYKIKDLLIENGIAADHFKLEDLGITGNGHMMMLENNSEEILNKILEWIG